SRKRDLAIHRFRQNPPHFKVITGDDVYDVGKGRNNLFHSIILFLLMVMRKQHGMLGRVNLGPSGVNILGIFNKR
ncbi:transmembrane 209-like, partial [Paramuricea clavata]